MTKQEKFNKYKKLVYAAVNHHFGNNQVIERKYHSFGITFEDLVQIGFMYLWKVIERIEDDNNPSGYIYRGVFMEVRTYMRNHGSLVKMPEKNKYECVWNSYNISTDSETELLDFISDNIETYREVENKLFFEQITKDLKEEDAQLINYRLKGLTQQEIADRIGITRQGVQVREQRILNDIRKMVG